MATRKSVSDLFEMLSDTSRFPFGLVKSWLVANHLPAWCFYVWLRFMKAGHFPVMLAAPMEAFEAYAAAWLAGLSNDIYLQ